MPGENKDNKKTSPEGEANPWEELTRDEEEEERKKQEEQAKEEQTRETKERTTPFSPAGVEKETAPQAQKKRAGRKKRETKDGDPLLTKKIVNPLWLRVSEAAKLGGIQTRSIRRALKSGNLTYKIVGNRYYIDLKSLMLYMNSSKKLQNKLKKNGIGQYVEKWKK